ncbi:hypothetical protein quinque_013235 [Culex quinquefasciatus]
MGELRDEEPVLLSAMFFQAIKTLLISTAVVTTQLRSPEAHRVTHVNLLEEMMLRSILVRLANICGEHGFVETRGLLPVKHLFAKYHGIKDLYVEWQSLK